MSPIQIISQDVFDKVRSRFQNLEMGDETGAVTIDPTEARFFDFDFVNEGANLGRVSISLNDTGSLKVYYSQGITENQEDMAKKMWYNFLREMRLFAMRRLLRFDTRDIAKDNLDKNDFQYLATKSSKEQAMSMNESRWSPKSTKKTSRAVRGRTEVIVRHNEAVDELYAGARSQPKKIKAIFIQNQDGERFKYPFIHPAGAFAMAQHVDHGGVPHDTAGKAIMNMSEQIAQLQEFSRHVRSATLHDDATGIVERTGQRLQELKSQVAALGMRHHYESWMETFVGSDSGDTVLDDVTMEQYKQKFTETNFKEEIAKFFPLIHKIMSETNTIDLESYVKEASDEKCTCDDSGEESCAVHGMKEDQVQEFIAPLIAAGARGLMALGPILARTLAAGRAAAPAVGKAVGSAATTAAKGVGNVAKATAPVVGQVAKGAADVAAKNAVPIAGGMAIWDAYDTVKQKLFGGNEAAAGEVFHDSESLMAKIKELAGGAISNAGSMLPSLVEMAIKYALPIGIVLAVIYGGKKLIDSLFSSTQKSPAESIEYFAEWADAVEQHKITPDQVSGLKQAISQLQPGELNLENDGANAYDFFGQFGIEDRDLEQKLKDMAGIDASTDPMQVFQAWAKDSYPELLPALGISDTSAPEEPQAQQPAPAPEEEPVAEEPKKVDVPAYMRKQKSEPGDDSWRTTHKDLEKDDERNLSSRAGLAKRKAELGMDEGNDPKDMIREIAEMVKQFYNADNESVGPFHSNEGIAIDIKKQIAEKYGDEAGVQAEAISKKFMEKLTQQWQERHGSIPGPAPEGDGLSINRLKELVGNIKQKVETYSKPVNEIGAETTNIMPAEDKDDWHPSKHVTDPQKKKELAPHDKDVQRGSYKDRADYLDKGGVPRSESIEMESMLKLAGLAK
jgi:hypothetical protein